MNLGKMRGFPTGLRALAFAWVAVALMLVTARAAATTNCNQTESHTILPPDRPATVYLTLLEQCGSPQVPSFPTCKAMFNVTTPMTVQSKCEALVTAIRQTQACVSAGFTVLDNCGPAPLGLAQFTVTGTACSSTTPNVSIAISNTGFNQGEIPGGTLPDYEAEVLSPVCTTTPGAASQPAAPAALQPVVAELVLRGTATGVSFISGQPAAVTAFVDNTNNGGVVTSAVVPTVAGMTATTIVASLNEKLAGAASCTAAAGPTATSSAIICQQPLTGNPVGFGISTSDVGIGLGNASAPANLVAVAFSGPAVVAAPAPASPMLALLLLLTLLALVGLWLLKRREATAS